jgi:casein kinase 1
MTTHVIASSHPSPAAPGAVSGGSSSSNGGGATIGQHFKVGKKIGEGSFGVVFEGINVLNQAPVAIKFVGF